MSDSEKPLLPAEELLVRLTPAIRGRLAKIALVVCDVDGVLTDGRLVYGPEGETRKTFHVRDGMGIRLLMENGIEVAIITARSGKAISARFKDLGVKHVKQGRGDKGVALEELMDSLGYDREQVAYIGDDVLDVPAIELASVGISVQDGHSVAREAADWVTQTSGGQGAVREVADTILVSRAGTPLRVVHGAGSCMLPRYTQERNARVEQGRLALTEEAMAIRNVADGLNESFDRAVQMILDTGGHVVVSGLGKSGHIGKKIAATLASTGTPAFYMHPVEAYHGDLGMIRGGEVALLLSYSGQSEEVIRLIPTLKNLEIPIIAMVGDVESPVAEAADIVIEVSVEREACPHNLAPTTSSVVSLALGDALAVVLMQERKFTEADFAKRHPGGALGRRLEDVGSDV